MFTDLGDDVIKSMTRDCYSLDTQVENHAKSHVRGRDPWRYISRYIVVTNVQKETDSCFFKKYNCP